MVQGIKEIYKKIKTVVSDATFEDLFKRGHYFKYSVSLKGEKQRLSEFKHEVEHQKGKIVFTVVVPDANLLVEYKRPELADKYKEHGRFANLYELALLGAEQPYLQQNFEALFALGSHIRGMDGKLFPYLGYEMHDNGGMAIHNLPRKRSMLLCQGYDVSSIAHSVLLPTGVVFVDYPKKKKST